MDIIRATGSAVGRCPSVIANGLIWTVATAGGEGSTVTDQTRVTLARLDSLLAAAGTNKHRIVEALFFRLRCQPKMKWMLFGVNGFQVTVGRAVLVWVSILLQGT